MSEVTTQNYKNLLGRQKWFKIANNTELIKNLIEAKRDLDEGSGISSLFWGDKPEERLCLLLPKSPLPPKPSGDAPFFCVGFDP